MIYREVRRRLVMHGVRRGQAGQIILDDRCLFLRFVRLHRACERRDFVAVQCSFRSIEEHLRLIEGRHLLVFACLYVAFFGFGPNKTSIQRLPDGRSELHQIFLSEISDEVIAIAAWARFMLRRKRPSFRVLRDE